MRKSRLSNEKQKKLVEFFVADSTARTAAVMVGVNKITANYYFKRLRELIFQEPIRQLQIFSSSRIFL
jgi:transposase